MDTETNFGGNQRWRSRRYRPAHEGEVLEILARHRNRHIRAVGRRHSWSPIDVCSEVTVDLCKIRQVQVLEGETVVRVGAGCRLQRLLKKLHANSNSTIPTIGVIKRQTIAGAISTGTHGSGRQSLSHFVVGVRFAAYDPATGEPKVYEYSKQHGDKLLAARCALGCAGILLSVDLEIVPKYLVAETARVETSLDVILQSCRARNSLTQFALVPFAWKYLVFERTAMEPSPQPVLQRLKALARRVINWLWVDVGFHAFVKLSLVLRLEKTLQRCTPWLACKYSRVDHAERVLTMAHHYFQHEEMEVFVPESVLGEALDVVKYATKVFASKKPVAPDPVASVLDVQLHASLKGSKGLHTQHYPFSIRRVLREDTLISMGSEAPEPLYAISVFTYHCPHRRTGYYAFCGWLARALRDLYGARLHWGKHFPLGADDMKGVYPRLEEFRRFCIEHDPSGVFGNRYTEEVLGLPAKAGR